jgi:hypothetical protein
MQHCKTKNLHKLLPDATAQALELIYKMLHWDPKVNILQKIKYQYYQLKITNKIKIKKIEKNYCNRSIITSLFL